MRDTSNASIGTYEAGSQFPSQKTPKRLRASVLCQAELLLANIKVMKSCAD
jgi:hypothetical protein